MAKSFDMGDDVVLFDTNPQGKMRSKWTGSYPTVAKHPDHTYVIETEQGKKSTVHDNRLRRYHARVGQVGVIYHEDDDFGEVVYTPLERSLDARDSVVFPREAVAHLSEPKARQMGGLLSDFGQLFVEQPRVADVDEHRITLLEGLARKSPHRYRIPRR